MANKIIQEIANQEYKYGFQTAIESETLAKGLSEDIIRQISAKKNEPAFMLEFRLKAYRHWLTMKEPHWGNFYYPKPPLKRLVQNLSLIFDSFIEFKTGFLKRPEKVLIFDYKK